MAHNHSLLVHSRTHLGSAFGPQPPICSSLLVPAELSMLARRAFATLSTKHEAKLFVSKRCLSTLAESTSKARGVLHLLEESYPP